MANHHSTITAALDADTLMQWAEHMDSDELRRDARVTVATSSIRDWLMGDISAHRDYLGLQSLDWLATEIDAPARTSEYRDSRGYSWFVWTLYRTEVQASIDGLGQILRLAYEQPGRFGASDAIVRAAHDWDRGCSESDFDIPDASGDGDDPTYVLCSILAFKRLLTIALLHQLPVVHMQYSFRSS